MPEIFNLTVAKALPATIVAGQTTMVNAANLLTLQPGEKASATNATGKVTIDLGAAVDFRQVALLYTSHDTVDDYFMIKAGSDPTMVTGVVLNTGIITLPQQALTRPSGQRHHFYHHLAGNVTARYVQITIGNNGVDLVTMGRLFVGSVLQLEYNVDYKETSWGYDEADEGEELESGVEVLVEKMPRPVLNFTATWVTQEEMDAGWEELGRLQYEGTPVLVARRPDPHSGRHNGLYYGRLRMVPVVAAEFDMFEVQGRIRSMI